MMRFYRRIGLLLVISCYAGLAKADAPSDALTSLLLTMQTMKADFTQRLVDQSARTLQESKGHMALQRPGKFRWDVVSPVAQLIIANGTKLWIYDKDLEQVTVRSFKSAAGQTPALLLSDNNLTLSKDFTVKNAAKKADPAIESYWLVPKDKENLFESVQLTFNHKQISEMQLRDHLGHITVIQFRNAQFGKPLAASLFTFNPPAHTDVIDETKPH